MSTPSNATTRERGSPVFAVAREQNLHPLVRLSSMYGLFVLETVGEWVTMDQARQEAETPDSLQYLTGSMRFLMDAVDKQQRLETLCRLVGGGQKNSLRQLEATYPLLKECGIDTSEMEAQAENIRKLSHILEAFADAHFGNANQVVLLLNSLEPRIHAVTTGKSAGTFTGRPN